MIENSMREIEKAKFNKFQVLKALNLAYKARVKDPSNCDLFEIWDKYSYLFEEEDSLKETIGCVLGYKRESCFSDQTLVPAIEQYLGMLSELDIEDLDIQPVSITNEERIIIQGAEGNDHLASIVLN
jgi:hypothetical protein